MPLINQPDRYGLIARSFHWLTAADITYDEARRAGRVTVTIDTTSLTLGTVTRQARTTEFFNVPDFPTALPSP